MLLSAYIQCYLWGRAEFKAHINPSQLSFACPPPIPLLTTTLALATHLALKHMRQPINEPLPSIEGCGLKFKCHNSPQKWGRPTAAPPLSKGMWAVFLMLNGWIGEWEIQGGTQEVGGPTSAYLKRTMMKVMVCFLPSLPPQPTDEV